MRWLSEMLKAKAPDEALKILDALDLYLITDERQPDADGKLRLDSKVVQRVQRLPPEYVRSRLRFVIKSDRVRVLAVDPMAVTVKGLFGDIVRKGRFEVAVDQVKAAIAKLTKAEPGRKEHPERQAILENYRQRKARRERNAPKKTAQWVEDEIEAGRMTEGVHPDTIRAWDRDDKKRM
jgi:hypothetical protein